jgi:hypothetical protein
MARGKKTGGRNFTKGQPGRQKGAKDRVPRSFKESIRALYQELAIEQPELFRAALVRGLKAPPSKSFQYLQLGAYYLDGKPKETIEVIDPSKLSTETIKQILKELDETSSPPCTSRQPEGFR